MFERLWAGRQYETASGPALSEYVFHANGNPVCDSNFEKLWSKARKKAGLAGKLFHVYLSQQPTESNVTQLQKANSDRTRTFAESEA